MVLAVAGLFKQGGTSVTPGLGQDSLGHLEHEVSVGLRRLIRHGRVSPFALVPDTLTDKRVGGQRPEGHCLGGGLGDRARQLGSQRGRLKTFGLVKGGGGVYMKS